METHPNINDFTILKILELAAKYPIVMKSYIQIKINNEEELCQKFIIVDGEWKLLELKRSLK